MRYIGIDPGASGAVCILDPSINQTVFIDLNPKKVPAVSVLGTLQDWHAHVGCRIAVEDVHSMANMSARSNFVFGGMLWRILTILECVPAPYEMVTPKVWQKAVGAPSRKEAGGPKELKQAVADMAQELYPSAELYGPKGGLKDGRSDSLMIAHYLRLTYGG
jgi:hypothetical protein